MSDPRYPRFADGRIEHDQGTFDDEPIPNKYRNWLPALIACDDRKGEETIFIVPQVRGTKLLPGIDGRSAWVRRCKDILAAHLSDLGGADNTSLAERSIIRRAAVLTTELERLEAKFAAAGEASAEELDIYARIAANLRRLLEAVGIRRRPKDIEPTFGELIREVRP